MSEADISKLSVKEDAKKDAKTASPAPGAAVPSTFQFNFSGTGATATTNNAAQPFSFNFGGEKGDNKGGQPSFNFQIPAADEAKKADGADAEEEEEEEDDDAAVKEFINSLPPWSQARLIALQDLHTKREELDKQFRAELRELERKYEDLSAPLFEKRAAIVQGAALEKEVSEKAVEMAAALPAEGADKPIEKFWLTALNNCRIVQSQITERDAEVLEHLTDIRAYSLKDDIGFKMEFHFNANPFFTNTVLTKLYLMEDDDEPVLKKTEGCEINWNAGKNTTVKMMKKKQKGKGKKGKVVMKQEPCESFFNFFSPPEVLTEEEMENIDEEEAAERSANIDNDYDTAIAIRDDIVPAAVKYFTGEADDEEDYPYYDDEEGDEEDGEGEHDDEDEEDDDEPPRGAKGRRGGGGGGGGRGGGRGRGQPECKQQ